ncbi:MAG TPA: helix-hairpin-helix domain-containing protein [Candidatus Nanoarchaeia archaeon]|nr:helix-hairpin-helix domain-containing protein [Candidatus Nanoarchaeia archaeon]
MKKYILILVIFFIPQIYSLCNEGQIDINSATLEELDSISEIGPVKAQAIIDMRFYETLDDLINVKGIKEITLQKIKNQGLACVQEKEESVKETEKVEENKSIEIESVEINFEESKDYYKLIREDIELKNISENNSIEKLEVIQLNNLNPKDIKTDEVNKELKKSDYSVYGLIGFSILLCCLFLIKKYRIKKNEFR